MLYLRNRTFLIGTTRDVINVKLTFNQNKNVCNMEGVMTVLRQKLLDISINKAKKNLKKVLLMLLENKSFAVKKDKL